MNIQEIEEYFKQLEKDIIVLKANPEKNNILKSKETEYELIKKNMSMINGIRKVLNHVIFKLKNLKKK